MTTTPTSTTPETDWSVWHALLAHDGEDARRYRETGELPVLDTASLRAVIFAPIPDNPKPLGVFASVLLETVSPRFSEPVSK